MKHSLYRTFSLRTWLSALAMCSILSLWACTGEPIEPKDKCQFNSDCTLNEQCVSGECKPKPTDGGNKEIITTEQTPQEPADEPSVEPTTGEEDAGNSDDLPEITTTEEPTNTEENVTDNTNTESDTCQDGDTRPCYTGETGTKDKGVCKAGTQTCFAGFWDAYCEGEVLPSQEECNGQDDDCNGQVDDNPTGIDDACQVSGAKGPCAQGETTCKSGKIECVSSVTPKTEVCDNGIDDDCDGTIDGGTCTCTPNEKRECYNGPTGTEGVGSCNKGEQVCGSDKKWGACQNETLPQAEVCNGKDDDCDGELDESYPEKGTSCADKTQKGECQKGTYICSAGKLVCQSIVKPASKETCNNGKDDDCNGVIDDNPPCPCKTGQTRTCYTGPPGTDRYSPCQRGKQTCSSGVWGKCAGEVVPQVEECNGKDDDCNGKIDESFSDRGKTCKTGRKGECEAGTYVCLKGSKICLANNNPKPEVCDNKDNDCDGYVDEGNPSGGKSCSVIGAKGECAKGITYCSTGRITCRALYKATTEVCNDNKDNDCDGSIDENPPCQCKLGQTRSCYTGPSGTVGVGTCSYGKQTCSSTGTYGRCTGSVVPVTEVCRDSKDNDCDKSIDEICGRRYRYGIVNSSGTFQHNYGLSTSKRTAAGTYAITATSSYLCDQRPAFVAPRTSSQRPVSVTCGSSKEHVVTLGTKSGTLQDWTFNIVIPYKTSGEVFGRAIPLKIPTGGFPKPTFKWTIGMTALYGITTGTITRSGTGYYVINHANCKTSAQPVFVSIHGSKPLGYASAYSTTTGKCYVRTYNLNGVLTDMPFNFWIPSRTSAAWASVNSSGSLSYNNYFSDQTARWKVTKYSSYYKTVFPAWTSKSAYLLTTRGTSPAALSGTLTTGGINVYTRSPSSGSNLAASFSVMFIQ